MGQRELPSVVASGQSLCYLSRFVLPFFIPPCLLNPCPPPSSAQPVSSSVGPECLSGQQQRQAGRDKRQLPVKNIHSKSVSASTIHSVPRYSTRARVSSFQQKVAPWHMGALTVTVLTAHTTLEGRCVQGQLRAAEVPESPGFLGK